MKKIKISFILVVLLICLSGCEQDKASVNSSSESHVYGEQNTSSGFFPESFSVSDLPQEKQYKIGSYFQYEDWSFKVEKVHIGKDLGTFPEENIVNFDGSIINEDGSKVDNYSYITIDLSVTNMKNEEQDLALGSFSLVDLNFKHKFAITGIEKPEFSKAGKKFFICTLGPSETISQRLLFIVSDTELMKEKILFCPNIKGLPLMIGKETAENLPFVVLEW